MQCPLEKHEHKLRLNIYFTASTQKINSPEPIVDSRVVSFLSANNTMSG